MPNIGIGATNKVLTYTYESIKIIINPNKENNCLYFNVPCISGRDTDPFGLSLYIERSSKEIFRSDYKFIDQYSIDTYKVKEFDGSENTYKKGEFNPKTGITVDLIQDMFGSLSFSGYQDNNKYYFKTLRYDEKSNLPKKYMINGKIIIINKEDGILSYMYDNMVLELVESDNGTNCKFIDDGIIKERLDIVKENGNIVIKRYDIDDRCIEDVRIDYSGSIITLTSGYSKSRLNISFDSNLNVIKSIKKDYKNDSSKVKNIINFTYNSSDNDVKIVSSKVNQNGVTRGKEKWLFISYDKNNYPMYEIDNDGNCKYYRFNEQFDKLEEISSVVDSSLMLVKDFDNELNSSNLKVTNINNSNSILSEVFPNEKRYDLIVPPNQAELSYSYSFNNSIGNKPYTFVLFIKAYNDSTRVNVELKINRTTIKKTLNGNCKNKYQLLMVTIQEPHPFNRIDIKISTVYYYFTICKAALYEGAYVHEFQYNSDGMIVKELLGNVGNTYTYDSSRRLIKKTNAGEKVRNIAYNENNNVIVYEKDNSLVKYGYDEKISKIKSLENIGLQTNASLISKNEYDYTDKTIKDNNDENGYKYTFGYDDKKEIISCKDSNDVISSFDNKTYPKKDVLRWSKANQTASTSICYDSTYKITNYEKDGINRYNFVYDSYDNLESIELDNSKIIGYKYDYYLDNINKVTFSDNSSVNYSFDEEGKISSIIYTNGDKYNYEYDEYNRITTIKGSNNKVKVSCEYEKNKLVRVSEDGLTKNIITYDNGNDIFKYDSIIQEKSDIKLNSSKYYLCDFENGYRFNGNTPQAQCGCYIWENTNYADEPESYYYEYNKDKTKVLVVKKSLLRYICRPGQSGTIGCFFFRKDIVSETLLAVYDSNSKDKFGIRVYFENEKLKIDLGKNNEYRNITYLQLNGIDEWNLFALSWKKSNDKFELYIHLNEEIFDLGYLDVLDSNFGDNLIFYLGKDGTRNENKSNDNIYFKDLFVSKIDMLDNSIINCLLQKMNNSLLNRDERQNGYVEDVKVFSNPYNFKIYPLHNDCNSIDGDMPYIYGAYRNNKDGLDCSFSYNEVNNKNTYYANGQLLAYKFGFSYMGTIMMNVLFDSDLSRKQVVFEHIFNNNIKVLVCRIGGDLILYVNGIEKKRIGGINVLNWNVVGLSFWKESEEVDYTSVEYNSFRLYLNGYSLTLKMEIECNYDNAITYIGRSKEDDINKLNGYIEMLCVRNSISSTSMLNDTLENIITSSEYSKEYDEFGRLKKKEISRVFKTIFSNSYLYKTNISDSKYSSCLIDKENFTFNDSSFERKYDYDKVGRVSRITDNLFGSKIYEYDYRGFLVKEKFDNHVYSYSYDNNGNIISIIKKDVPYLNSTSDNYESKGFTLSTQSVVIDPIIGGEGNSSKKTTLIYNKGVKDLISKIDGNEIRYSGLYPITYKNNSLSWDSNRLISFGDYSFVYNHNDLLVSIKYKCSEIKHLYYDGTRLIKEVDVSNNKTIYYLYDNSGLLYGLSYNNKLYFYVRDSLLNILGIIDYSGNVVVKYDCSAYGEEISCTDNSGIGLGKLNKFKYKGYYYIDEISLFYVTSRFYDPKLGRFISPDATKYLSPYDLNGLNLFAYCFNDPVNMVDPSGHFAFSLFLAISWGIAIGMAVGFGTAAYCDSEDNGQIDGSVGLETYVTSVGLCGIAGGLTGGLLPSIAGGIALGGGALTISSTGVAAVSTGITISGAHVLVSIGMLSGMLVMMAEHRVLKNGKGRTKSIHQKGQTRKKTDRFGGEKGDFKRPFRRHFKSHLWWLLNLLGLEDKNDEYYW